MSGKSTMTLRDRLDRRVVRSADAAGCWLWCGAKNRKPLARLFGVSQPVVDHIWSGRSWAHVPTLETPC